MIVGGMAISICNCSCSFVFVFLGVSLFRLIFCSFFLFWFPPLYDFLRRYNERFGSLRFYQPFCSSEIPAAGPWYAQRFAREDRDLETGMG